MDEDDESLSVGFGCQISVAIVAQPQDELGLRALRSFDAHVVTLVPISDVAPP